MSKLTPKQQAFVDEYLIDLNATQAAKRAGYSDHTAKQMGTENLAKPVIKEAIEARMKEKEEQRIAKQNEVLEYLTKVMRGETKEQVLRGVDVGVQEKTHIEVSAKDRIKAAELIGKRYALWTDKQDVSITVPIFKDDVPEDDGDE
jgi:phage terminase small subunit